MGGDGTLGSAVLDRLRKICLALPAVEEETAWSGTRWVVRRKTFAHVLEIVDGRPPAYSRAVGTDGPATVLAFRGAPDDVEALRAVGHPFAVAHWGRDVILLTLADPVDWEEVAELLVDSYCAMAPQQLVAAIGRRVDRDDAADGG